MKHFASQFLRDNKGVTAIEYGLIAGVVAIAKYLRLLQLLKRNSSLNGSSKSIE